MSDAQLAATKAVKEKVACIERAIFRGDDSSWRPVCDAFGYPNLMLAEVVTSAPGGAAQDSTSTEENRRPGLVPSRARQRPYRDQPAQPRGPTCSG